MLPLNIGRTSGAWKKSLSINQRGLPEERCFIMCEPKQNKTTTKQNKAKQSNKATTNPYKPSL